VPPEPPTILIVEDHRPTRTFLADNLSADGFEPLEAGSADEAAGRLAAERPDLALLDLGLPDRDGLDLLRQIRTTADGPGAIDPGLPVILLTGRGGEVDRVRGFERGADDYLVKPFSYGELRGRIQAVLLRCQTRPARRNLHVGPLDIDVFTREVLLRGEPVHLSKKEFALLRALAEDPTRVYTRDELLRDLWGFAEPTQTRTLDSHASRLRHKLARSGDRLVVNVWGVGYRLVDGPDSR
jgi:DNA-binding response OmpR family regulator